ncbi:MAG: insulinase family protein [Planctomycetes bacterium]|nr:insulinase family protein [Planctomycetota bacterium]
MTRGLALALLVLGALAPAAVARQGAPLPEHPRELRTPPLQPFTPPAPQRLQLGRGARLVVIENHELPLVDGTLLFRGGSALDPPGRAGLCELLADTLRSGGSESTPGAVLDDRLDALAATLTVSATPDALRVDFACLTEDLDAVLEAIGELLVSPAYPTAELEKSRRRLLTRLRARETSAATLADRALAQAVHGADSPWARTASEATLATVTREELLAHHRDHLGSDRLVVGVIGDVRAATLGAKLELVLARLPRARAAAEPAPPVFLQPARTRICLVDHPGARQSEVRLSAPGVRRIDGDYTALGLWSYAVGYGGSSNRMMVRLRAELGLVYDGALYFAPGWEHAGRLEGSFSTRNETVGAAVAALQELLRGGLAPLPAEELELVRGRMQRAEVFQVDRPLKRLARALDLAFHEYPSDFWQRHAERLRALAPEEVAQAVARHLDPERLVVVVVGPAEELRAQLEPLGKVVLMPGPAPVDAPR